MVYHARRCDRPFLWVDDGTRTRDSQNHNLTSVIQFWASLPASIPDSSQVSATIHVDITARNNPRRYARRAQLVHGTWRFG